MRNKIKTKSTKGGGRGGWKKNPKKKRVIFRAWEDGTGYAYVTTEGIGCDSSLPTSQKNSERM